MLALGLALAALIWLSLGLLGRGAFILTVPVLVYVLGFAARPAIPMSLPAVDITSLAGAGMHWPLGNVHVRSALTFGASAMLRTGERLCAQHEKRTAVPIHETRKNTIARYVLHYRAFRCR